MTTEMWLIAAARLAGSVPVLRWAFAGALIAMLVDQSDLFMMNLIDLGGVDDYQTFDKYLDQAYLLAFLVVALRWQGPARTIAVALYGYRLIGFVAFEVTQERDVLLFFPNFFEYWFLLIAALKHFDRDPFAGPEEHPTGDDRRLSPAVFGAIAGVLIALKLFQEYALHYGRWLDSFTAVEAVEAIWRFLTPPY